MDYSEEEISREFKKLTGQDVETVLSLAGKDTSPTSPTHIRYALHLAIILANSIGAPKGAVLQTSQQGGKEGGISKNAVTDVGTGAEVSTHVQDSAMEARLKKMEQQLSVSTQSQRKDKVEEALRNGSVVFPVPWTPMVITGASCCPLTNIAYSCNFPGALLSRLESPQSVIRMPATVHSRLAELERSVDSTPYNQKKSALERELLAFFDISVCNIRRISPEDICHFLIKKDGKGKTRIHSVNCPYLGRVGPSECECPSRLSAGTVQSLVGQLKSIFKVRGLGVEWDEGLCSGNPASSLRVQKYVKAIQQEQAKSHVKVSQAKPLFFGKLTKVFSHIDDLLSKVSENPAERFVLLRDQAFFKLQFFSGDRAGDLAKCFNAGDSSV
ncbi:uncharacterized protein [Argopecten irradians]|uniref:uncharacterized protein n=1 Tax=Argopecten irradians TaxID=31199 RepID=UPI0037119687